MRKSWKKALIFLVLISVLCVVLIYLFSGEKGFLPYFGINQTNIEENNDQPRITVQSDFGTTTTIRDSRLLENRLNELGFWDQNNVTIYSDTGKINSRKTVRFLQIILTNKLQSLGRIESINPDGSRSKYQSFGTKYDTTTQELTILLHVDESIVNGSSKKDIEKRFSGILLSTAFDLTHPMLPSYKSFEERLEGKDEFIKEVARAGEYYFSIEK